jgi:hypothetical protein
MNKVIFDFKYVMIVTLFIFILTGCTKNSNTSKGAALFETQCARCHISPDISHLTKDLWANAVLPEMGARMGIKEGDFKPYKGMGFEEMEIIHNSAVYPFIPSLNQADWKILKEYIINNAPDSLPKIKVPVNAGVQKRFRPHPISLDTLPGSFITFLKYQSEGNRIWAGDIGGNLVEYRFNTAESQTIGRTENAIVDYSERDSVSYITDIGILNPSELSSGKIIANAANTQVALPHILHRPVNNLVVDLNNDGSDEMVVSEFGNLIGSLSLLSLDENGEYKKSILLGQPGSTRTIAKDMNKDGKLDLIVLTSQGDESITILYQKENLKFSAEKVIRFSPIYGTSWFEMIDYDGDGDDDIVTVNGDNADKTYIHKPYHGLRLHLNDGNNVFTEAFFYPLNGATRFVVNDFDQDGDFDFAVISTFPDYENAPELALVYLENVDKTSYNFQPHIFKEANISRWFLMDTGDFDLDGDTDMILSALTYSFTPVPPALSNAWNETKADLLFLENTLIVKDQ